MAETVEAFDCLYCEHNAEKRCECPPCQYLRANEWDCPNAQSGRDHG
jgi:hypothetical protein